MSLQKTSFSSQILFVFTIILLLVATLFIYPSSDTHQSYDVVVVGGGIAGLDAALHLNKFNTLLLEKNDYLGGRIKTKVKKGIPYELGALFINNFSLLPFDTTHYNLIRERALVGFFKQHKLWLASTLFHAIINYPPVVEDKKILMQVNMGNYSKYPLLSKESQLILSSFFNTINPGKMDEYMPQMIPMAFLTFRIDHLARGASQIIDSYRQNITGEIFTNATVLSVADKGDSVEVTYKRSGKLKTVTAKAVIVATPSGVANKIITKKSAESEKFLSSIKYGSGIAVVIAISGKTRHPFRYIATPDYPFGVVYQTHTIKKEITILTAYYLNDKTKKLKTTSDKTIIADTIKNLKEMNIIDAENVLFTDIQRWDSLGTIINQEAYGAFNSRMLQPSHRVFLAGDYTMYSPSNRLAYGSIAAMMSGRKAAKKVAHILGKTTDKNQQKQHNTIVQRPRHTTHSQIENIKTTQKEYYPPLLRCTAIDIHQQQPVYASTNDLGDIAYYGYLLKASKDPRLAKYLVSHAKRNQFEFHHGLGASLLDSTLVLEGLISLNTYHDFVGKALDTLIDKYYDEKVGAFRTVNNARTPYWNGVDVDSTAQAAYLLYLYDAKKYKDIIKKSAEFIARKQNQNGSWSSRWFPLQTYTTFYCAQLLYTDKKTYQTSLERTAKYIESMISQSGSVKSSLMETAITFRLLHTIQCCTQQQKKLKKWLQTFSGNSSTPLLYYWETNHTQPRLQICGDKGKIAQAWKILALSKSNP